MILAGIDYSYTSPAICVYDTNKDLTFDNILLYNIGTKKRVVGTHGNIEIQLIPEYSSQEERFRNIRDWASDILIKNKVESACIEGYSLGANAGLVFDIAENGSLIKQFMNLNDIDFTMPSPTQVKKNFAGKGNAKKQDMVNEFHNRFPGIMIHEILGVKEMVKPIDDLCDSFAVLLSHEYFKGETK